MIRAEDIRALAEEHLLGTPGFLVDVTVSDGSNIRVLVDHDDNTSIEFCMALSRHIESSLDREVQDFSLDVSSPGLDQPLKLHRQYIKNVGREVAVMPVQGAKIEGGFTPWKRTTSWFKPAKSVELKEEKLKNGLRKTMSSATQKSIGPK